MPRPFVIHRMNSNARPLCGAASGRCSASGVCLTCPECIRLSAGPTREEALAQIQAAADRFRAEQDAFDYYCETHSEQRKRGCAPSSKGVRPACPLCHEVMFYVPQAVAVP